MFDGFSHQVPDIDAAETAEWLDSFDAVVEADGKARARFLLMKLLERARSLQVGFPATVSTPYVNTIPADEEPWFPGDEHLERRIRAYIRWNAAAMVTRANMRDPGIGGHLSTYASSAALYEVGFNHFFHGKDGGAGDQVYFQGHASPGIYARAFVEGRLDEEHLDNFRFEVAGHGLSSYPHPRLMPELWEYPTVSMGLGPLSAVYQASFNRYLLNRGIVDTRAARVWCFVGDGEFDEPESRAGLGLAAREGLDNLVFVVNCNLQRLDGPVRGNGKIIQELEAELRGNGWNVIKVIWGSRWDELLARDVDGVLVNQMNETPDGEFQKFATESGAYIREHFFGPDPRLQAMVAHLSDEELQSLPRGGHDYRKLYAAYKAAVEHSGSPTAILAKTVKGWTLGPEIEARNATHQIKKMTHDQLRALRDRLYLAEEIPDAALDADRPPYYRPAPGSLAFEYLTERRRSLGGYLPSRVVRGAGLAGLPRPAAADFAEFPAGSRGQAVSTTMAFARLLRNLLRDPELGQFVVPIIPDEGRTFGLDAMFSEFKIYAAGGQRYTPVDAGMMFQYAESESGQLLEQGITEAGSMASFIAAATSYATWSRPMLPLFLYYSMFGFQRIGDLIWQCADARGRGFLLGCTAGRTTMNGEGLQHEDGHSHLLASVIPSLRAYDPAFAYEMAILVEAGIEDMYGPNGQDNLWYITLYNENYPMPALAAEDAGRVREGVVRGMYRFTEPAEVAPGTPGTGSEQAPARSVTLLFSGPSWQAAMRARDLLATDWNVSAEAWSVTSYKALREDALSVERWNRLHPGSAPRQPLIARELAGSSGPVVAVSDYLKAVPDQVARFVPQHFSPLGTDGFGRSDTREALRRHFEVDAEHVVVAVLAALAATGDAKAEEVAAAIAAYGIDPEAIDPRDA
ncbi:MAG TPA: pyruvate dehydrogenase (acetyl-transferring), homodimeric type [Acidimicrobiales bacterium]|nr:pyruvate dehydrogenase (acetyl-transferring), homodimeric type [Acidimicrobiales bacterium]